MPTDFRAREDAPLTEEEWRLVDLAVQDAARARLCGRRFLSLFGPLGAGVEYVEADRLSEPQGAVVSLQGDDQVDEVRPLSSSRRKALPLPMLYRDSRLYWRDLERSRQQGMGLDLSSIIAAAGEVAQAEDQLVFRGDARLGLEGLLTTPDIQSLQLGAWTAPGDGYAQIVRAAELLQRAGHPGPYALVLSPELLSLLQRVSDLTGTLEVTAVERLVRGPVLASPAVPGGMLCDPSAANMDLCIGIDLCVAYADTDLMNHRLRVLETAVLRVKRPQAIVRLDLPTV